MPVGEGVAEVKPLASPVVELRVTGGLFLAAGTGLCAVIILRGQITHVIDFFLGAILFGLFMYGLSRRPMVERAVAKAEKISDAQREALRFTMRRTALIVLFGLGAAVAIILQFDDSPIAGFVVGDGVALLASGRWLQRWERQHAAEVFVEARWRWSRRHTYYVMESGSSAAPAEPLKASVS